MSYLVCHLPYYWCLWDLGYVFWVNNNSDLAQVADVNILEVRFRFQKPSRFWSDFFSDLTVHFQHFVFNQKALHFTENKIQWNQMFNSSLSSCVLAYVTFGNFVHFFASLCIIRFPHTHTQEQLCAFLCRCKEDCWSRFWQARLTEEIIT